MRRVWWQLLLAMLALALAVCSGMNDSKEEDALCNNVQNHRQQLLNHQLEIDRDLEAGSCGDYEPHEEGIEGGEEDEEVVVGEDGVAITKAEIPPLYNVEPGCTALGCYSAIGTVIVMFLGILALLMYSSPKNMKGDYLFFPDANSTESSTTDIVPEEEIQ